MGSVDCGNDDDTLSLLEVLDFFLLGSIESNDEVADDDFATSPNKVLWLSPALRFFVSVGSSSSGVNSMLSDLSFFCDASAAGGNVLSLSQVKHFLAPLFWLL